MTKAAIPLTESKFYSQYRQHILRAGSDIQAIFQDGFKSGIGPNLLPASRGELPANAVDRKYAPKAGDTVLLVPRDGWRSTPNGDKIKGDWKPAPSDFIAVAADNPSMYDEYVRAVKKSTAPGSGGVNFSLADSNRKLKELLKVANETGVSDVVVDVADVSRDQAADLQNAGIDIDESFKHTVDVSGLRHAINRHSDPKIERSRNQIALVNGDFLKINEVVSNPDAYAVGPMSKRSLQMVAYIKDMGDGTILYIEEVRTSKSRMAMLSMRKFPSTKDFSSIAQTLLSNARSDAKEVVIIYPSAVQSQDHIQSTLPPTIVINGVTRPTTNSKGQPIHPTLDGVRNFWDWFGDSKAVDAEGTPQIVLPRVTGEIFNF